MNISYKILPSYDHLIDAPRNIHYPKKDIHIENAPEEIRNITLECYKQVKGLSKHLYHPDIKQFAYNILDWCLKNFNYQEDNPEVDQYREPARAWKDKNIDCDCFTIFINSLLLCSKINCQSVMVGCNGKDYHHIYAAIDCRQNDDGSVSGGIIIDPVMKEKTIFKHPEGITKSKITNIMMFERLSGNTDQRRKFLVGLGGLSDLVSPATQKLMDFRNNIIQQATKNINSHNDKLKALKPHFNELSKLNYCIALNANPEEQWAFLKLFPAISHVSPSGEVYVNSDKSLLKGLGELIREDIAGFIGCDLNGLDGIDGIDCLGSLKSKLKSLKNKVESKVKTAVNKVESAAKDVTHAVGDAAVKAAKTVHEEAKKGLEVAETIAKKTIHIIAKVNPLGLVARNALLILLQLNAFNLARKLSVGSGTLADAQSREYTESEYNRIKAEVTKCAKLFHTLGGEEKHFYDAINKGKNKRPLFGIGNKNVSGLGVISEASITAASGIIAGISSIIKPILSLFKKKDAGDPNDEVTSYPHTNPDGSILLNASGDISYPDGSKYIAKPTDGKPYFQKSDGTKEYDKDEIIQEQESEHDKLSNDLLKAHGESTTNDDGKSKSNVLWYVGGAAAVAAGIFVLTR